MGPPIIQSNNTRNGISHDVSHYKSSINKESLTSSSIQSSDNTLIPQPQTGNEEREIILENYNTRIELNSKYYIISSAWFIHQWAAYTGFNYMQPNTPAKVTNHNPPSMIDNSDILIPDRQWAELKPNLQEYQDYCILNQSVWELLVHWYGLKSNDDYIISRRSKQHHAPTKHHATPHTIERIPYEIGVFNIELRLNLYPIFLQLSFVDTNNAHIDYNKGQIVAPFINSSTLVDVIKQYAPSTIPQLTPEQQKTVGGKLLYGRVWIRSEALNVRNELQIDELKRVYSEGHVDTSNESNTNEATTSSSSIANAVPPSPRQSITTAALSPSQHATMLDTTEHHAALAADEWVLLEVEKHFQKLEELELESGISLLIEYRKTDGWWSRSSVNYSNKSTKSWTDFTPGDSIDALDIKNIWYEAHIKNIDEDKGLIIHFYGWDDRNDEAINPLTSMHKLAPVNTRTCGKYVQKKVESPSDARTRNNSLYSPTSPLYLSSSQSRQRHHSITPPAQRGAVGLRNLGNTCFMNSTLQCLSNTPALTAYFVEGAYKAEINRDNPLGWKGRIAEEYGNLLTEIWSGDYSTVDPRPLKTVIGGFQPRFSGYAQHDSSELLSFLLDGLHEDLNRVKKKRYVEQVESNGRNDSDVAREAWQRHLIRNQSIIVDLFQGQLKSKLVCPECNRISVTFDPMMFLSVPIPETQSKIQDVIFVPAIQLTTMPRTLENNNNDIRPIRLTLKLNKHAAIADVKQEVIKTLKEPRITSIDQLYIAEVYQKRIWEAFDDDATISKWSNRDEYWVYEIHPESVIHESNDIDMNTNITSSTSVNSLDSTDKEDDTIIDDHVMSVVPYTGNNDNDVSGTEYLTVSYSIKADDNTYGTTNNTHHPTFISLPKKQLHNVFTMDLLHSLQYSMLPIIRVDRHKEWLNEKITDFNDLPFKVILTDKKASTKYLELNNDNVFYNGSSNRMNSKELTLNSDTDTMHVTYDTSNAIQCDNDNLAIELLTNNNYMNGIDNKEQLINTPSHLNISQYGSKYRYSYMSHSGYGFHIIFPSSFAEQWLSSTSDSRIDHSSVSIIHNDAANNANKQLTVNDCISAFVAEETLGINDSWYCSQCKKHQQATKKFDLWSLPDILIIHFKRFSYNTMYRDKIDKFIDFPIHDLDLSQWIVNNDMNEKNHAIYDLYAVSNHYGGLGGGHYTAFAQNILDNKWYRLDDSFVTPLQNTEDCKTPAAYVLFYRRKNMSTQYQHIKKQTTDQEHKVQDT